MSRFVIDLPNPYNLDGLREYVTEFDTELEALLFAREHFGADSDGRICLVSEVADDDTESD